MTTISIQVSASALRALAANVAPKSDTRPVMAGVCVKVSGHDCRAYASNRAMLAVIYSTQPDYLPPVEFVLPREAIKSLKSDGKHGKVTLAIDPANPVECRIGGVKGGDLIVRCVEGQYPDIARVIPQTVTGAVAQYNPELIAALDECYRVAFDASDRDHLRLWHNGPTSAAVLTGAHDEFLGVCMPMRTDEQTFALPSWLAPTPTPVALAA